MEGIKVEVNFENVTINVNGVEKAKINSAANEITKESNIEDAIKMMHDDIFGDGDNKPVGIRVVEVGLKKQENDHCNKDCKNCKGKED